jgi:hypothetical protein
LKIGGKNTVKIQQPFLSTEPSQIHPQAVRIQKGAQDKLLDGKLYHLQESSGHYPPWENWKKHL